MGLNGELLLLLLLHQRLLQEVRHVDEPVTVNFAAAGL
jgi:hypothetical protein